MSEIKNLNGYDLKDGTARQELQSVQHNISDLESTINNVQSQLTGLTSGSPLVAASTSGMTDTSHIYVNTSDGHWYYYDGTTWQDGGTYQSTENSEVIDIRDTYDNVTYDTAGDSVRNQVEQLREINNMNYKGYSRIKGTFINGNANSSGIYPQNRYRIMSANKISYPYDIKIPYEIDNLYRNIVVTYSDSEATTGIELQNRRGFLEVPANTLFILSIRKITEDTTSTADIYTFSKNAIYKSEITTELNNINKKITNNIANINKKVNSTLFTTSEINGTLVTGKYISCRTGSELSSDNGEYLVIDNGFNSGETILVTGRTASNTIYPFLFFVDSNNELIETYGETTLNTNYSDYEVNIPYGTSKIYVNGSIEYNITPTVKKKTYINDYTSFIYPLNIGEALVREAKKNPFEFSPFDKGYISFVFDDLRYDIDLVASIFAEYGYKLGIAAIPSNLTRTCNGLNSDSQGYTVGMSAKEVCDRVVSLGGEIMSHNNSPVITNENQYDYGFMYNYFIKTKQDLEDNGYNIRGIIRAGGTGAISGTPEIEKWLIGNYEYSNLGTAINYSQDRINITTNIDSLKAQILEAYNNHTWIKIMGHSLGNDSLEVTEATLREILSYCQSIGIEVVTYGDMFDNFSSSKLLNSI